MIFISIPKMKRNKHTFCSANIFIRSAIDCRVSECFRVFLDMPSDAWWPVESHIPLVWSISVLIRAPVRGILWSEALAAMHSFLCHNIPHPFPFVLLQQYLFQCSYNLCSWSETAAILGVLGWQPLPLVWIMLSSVKKQMVREEETAVYYTYRIINTVECLQNSTQWSATGSFMQVFAEAIQKSEW